MPVGTPPCEIRNSTLQHKVARHSPISNIAFLHWRREFLDRSIDDAGIAQGPRRDHLSTAAVAARAHGVFQPTIEQLRTQRDIVPRTKPAHRAPRAGARALADAPHDADVVGADLEGGGAPVGQPARERVEQHEGRDVVRGQVVRRVREPAEGGGTGGPVGAIDDQEQLVRGRPLGDGEPAGVSEREQRADDVLRVVLPRERAHLGRHAAHPRRGAAAAGGLEPRPALEADDRVEVFPEELPAEIAWKVDVAVGKGVDHEERVQVGGEEAVEERVVAATVSELLHDRASDVKGIGGH